MSGRCDCRRVPGAVGGLIVFRHLAHRLCRPGAAILAVMFYAVSYYPIRHAAEVKPYATDMFVCVALLALAVEYWKDTTKTRWLWALAFVAPFTLALSFPAAFVTGGLGMGLAFAAWKSRHRAAWLPLAAFGVTVVVSFGTIYWLSAAGQETAWRDVMRRAWIDSFPPSLAHPFDWAKFMLDCHTGEMFAYPVGSNRGGSTLTALLCVLAVVGLLRQRAALSFLVACSGMFGLAYAAAALQRYPYGNNERMVQYLGPMICILAGHGAALAIGALRRAAAQDRALWMTGAAFGTLAVGILTYEMVRPYKYWRDYCHQSFVRWFWTQDASRGEIVCLASELGCDLRPSSDDGPFYTYQRIYSPRHRQPPTSRSIASLPADRPVRCVAFGPDYVPVYVRRKEAWLRAMTARFDLQSRMEYRVLLLPNVLTDHHGIRDLYGVYELYQFVPRKPGDSLTSEAGSGAGADALP